MKIATSFMLLLATAASASVAEHSGIRGPSAVTPVVADDAFEDSVLIQATAKKITDYEKSAIVPSAFKGLRDDEEETIFVDEEEFDEEDGKWGGHCWPEGHGCSRDYECCDSTCKWVNGAWDGICTSTCTSTGQLCHNNNECCKKFCDWSAEDSELITGRCT